MSQLVPQMKEDIPQPSEILQEYWQCSLLVYSCLSLLEFIVSQNTSGWKRSLFGPAHLLKAGATPMIIRLLRDLSSWILNLPKDGVPTACGGGSVPAPSQWQLSSGYPTETALAWLPQPCILAGLLPPEWHVPLEMVAHSARVCSGNMRFTMYFAVLMGSAESWCSSLCDSSLVNVSYNPVFPNPWLTRLGTQGQ